MKRTDQVFQLSLTELAFTLVFLLLLLVGWRLVSLQQDRDRLASAVQQESEQKALKDTIDAARAALAQALEQGGSGNAEAVISTLVEQRHMLAANQQLRQRIAELDSRLTALTELQHAVEKAGGNDVALRNEVLQKEMKSALAFKAAVRQLSGKDIPSGKETAIAQDLVRAATKVTALSSSGKSPELVQKENADLRGQVAFLKGKLEARGGRDYPPCWAEEGTGKVEFLLNIEIHDNGLVITPGWPARREQDAQALPGISALVLGEPLLLNDFRSRMEGIDRDSKSKNCRHYVVLHNKVNQLDIFNRYRYGVEDFFYKYEQRSGGVNRTPST